ncbi:MAG: PKD domain-containing protein [Bacteroidia bacterium]|nr:PKD domain-containing protein [Bacteroidia bacterium]
MRSLWVIGGLTTLLLAQPPGNDNCTNATFIPFGNPHDAYGLGTFLSDVVDITHATLQPGEYIPPGVPNGKSVWYRFYLPTTRTVRIVIRQVGIGIDPTHVGWTLYRGTACLPTAAQQVDPPIVLMEGYTHVCLRRGWYLIQVGANLAASGPIYIELIVEAPRVDLGAEAYYDHMANAQHLGLLSTSSTSVLLRDVTLEFACQSVSPGEAICENDSSWSKSTWHVFRTDAHIDWLGVEIVEDPWNTSNPSPREWRLFLYQGNALTDSAAGLVLITGCISLIQPNGTTPARADWLCQLQPNTYYSLKILGRTGYANQIRLRLYERGSQPALSANPLLIPPSHHLGTLTFGPTYSLIDYWSCQSRISSNPCLAFGSPVTPDDTIQDFDLALYYTFTLDGAAHVQLWYSHPWSYYYCMGTVQFRIFQGNTSVDGCNLPLMATVENSGWVYCLPAGTYTVQALARISRTNLWQTCSGQRAALGLPITFHVRLGSTPRQLFGLHTRPQEADSINNGNPLLPGVTYYATQDTLDCRSTVLPAGDVCGTANNRAIYRIIRINQEGILEIGGGNYSRFYYRLYRGDARVEPIVGGRIQNLIDQVGCQSLYWPVKVCVTPGYYTLVSFGDESDIGERDRPWFIFHAFPPGERRFYVPASPASLPSDPDPRPHVEEIGTIGGTTHALTATWTRVTCEDNPLTILGYAPCGGATKQFYWEVYIAEPSLVTFSPQYAYVAWPELGVRGWRTFRGRISDGSLTSLFRDCHSGYTACMEPGWYTFVVYAAGGTYTNPTYTSGRGGAIGNRIWFTLSRDTRFQKFSTFATADRPGSLDWVPQYTYAPNQHRSYTLDWEFWSCASNLPFPSGITSCHPSENRVSYRVFSISRPSYVVIFQSGCLSRSRLYAGDITNMAPPYTIVHDCFSGTGRICWLPPGTYTLVTFASDGCIGQTYTPTIYVDSVGYSRFNYARGVYDFGTIPADNQWYNGRIGDPLGPYGRPPSTDFIFCTTDAFATDPTANCPIGTVNNATPGDAPPTVLPVDRRRNLWYTFVVSGSGRVYVRVRNLTAGGAQPAFAVYRSDDPPSTFPGVIDSTIAQGLSLIASSQDPWYCCVQYQTISFLRDVCNVPPPTRYYIVVERNTCGKEPNLQIEVDIRYEPLPAWTVRYDFYSHANVIIGNPTTQCDGPYTWSPLNQGTYMGCEGDLTCATRDPTDQNTCGTRTIWYAFESAITGYIYLNYDRPGVSQYNYSPQDIQLYYQVVPGDSTSTGLVRVPLTGVWETHPTLGYRYWGRGCVRPGRYYIMITGCNHLGVVVPRIWLRQHPGDFCRDSVSISIPAAGGPYSANLFIDCFTIGEGVGESDTIMACFGTPIGKKSAWVLVNNLTSDTMNFDVRIVENTTALGEQVLYRVLTGDCNTMNQEECVAEGTHVILHLKCRPPLKSFWVQVVMPEWATGHIEVQITATPITQTCVPPDPNKPRANFDFRGICLGEPTQFLNYSSVGPGMSYYWLFGDGGSSTQFQPQYTYTRADTYLVCLGVSNGTQSDTACRILVVYPYPGVNLSMSPSSPVWLGVPITFTPVYTDTVAGTGQGIYWNFCAGSGACGASQIDHVGPTPPPVSYSLPGRKRVCVTLTNGAACSSTLCIEFEVIVPPLPGGPYDGAASQVLRASCPSLSYRGGPYDGASTAFVQAVCRMPISGGPYDGAAAQMVRANCPESFYPGGPYDGAATALIRAICWPITPYTGGPYDGAANATILNCPPPQHPYAGGPYDGAATQILTAGCPSFAYRGGPYDGAASALQSFPCPSATAGGPYDGSAAQVITAACATLSVRGGPYDGAAAQVILARCPLPIAGGPYDGAATAYYGTFTTKDTAVCVGSLVTLNVGVPSDWYRVPSGGTPFQTNSATFSTTATRSELYWIENACTAERVPLTLLALPRLNGQFSVSPIPYCTGQPVTFTNQTLVSGPSQPSFGSLITGFGTHGTVPNLGQLTFSSVQSANFVHLGDGIYQNGGAWTAANSSAGTQWAMWRYPIPRSVNRIVFWGCQTCPNAAQRLPYRARLYYNDGSGWKLAKTFHFSSGQYVYDSGIFTETQIIFAQLWRLEFDVRAANAPNFGEFQVYSSSPVIGGQVQWSCDGGLTWHTGPTQACIWNTPGIKTLQMVVNAPGACPDTMEATVEVVSCVPLAAIQSTLTAFPTPNAQVQLVWQTNTPIQYALLEKKVDTGWVLLYRHDRVGATGFTWLDSFPSFEQPNLYRVVSEHGTQALVYSNVAEVEFTKENIRNLSEFARAFPNPVHELLTVQVGIATEKRIGIRAYDVRGTLVSYLTPETYPAGFHEFKLDVRGWATGIYTLQVMIEGTEYSLKLLRLLP